MGAARRTRAADLSEEPRGPRPEPDPGGDPAVPSREGTLMPTNAPTPTRRGWITAAAVAAAGVAAVVAVSTPPADAALQPGSGVNDVLIGRDNDNAANAFIQPAGVTAKQHLEDTDVLTGGPGHDLLIGLKGSDVLTGGSGDDVLVGGNERGVAPN